MTQRLPLAVLLTLLLAACGGLPVHEPSSQHISVESVPPPAGKIPEPVQVLAAAPRPKPAAKVETYSVVVSNVRAQDLLFALARDAKINVDIHPGISGTVTLNAIDQTLPQLLERIAHQVDMRWELDGPNLEVMPDSPYLHTYKVDYVNMTRDVTGTIASNNRVSSATSGAGGGSGGAGNVSSTHIDNTVKNRFWETLEKNIKDLLRETDKILPEGSSETVVERSDQQSTTGTGAEPSRSTGARSGAATQVNIAASPNPTSMQQAGTTVVRRTTFREAASVIINPETGVVTVRATSRQHQKIQEYLDEVISSSRRQVMIEATIVEVTLSDSYSQGIDWSRLRTDGSGTGFSISGSSAGATAINSFTPFTLTSKNNSTTLNLTATLKLLESFGNVKVLSTPTLSVLNNQSAILRVVEDFVYFKVDETVTAGQTGSAQKSITTTPQTVSVGLTLAVTPQIGESDSVMLDVRPTITSVSALVTDPNPDLSIQNNVPQLKTREIESVMRVASGDIAVLGGLMQDSINYNNNRLPWVSRIPILGELVTNRNNASQKTELVVFLRPVVVKDASLTGDYASFRNALPSKDVFQHGNEKYQPFRPDLDFKANP